MSEAALPWACAAEGEDDDGEAAEEDDFGFANIEEDLAKYGDDELIAEAIRNGDLRQFAKAIEVDLRKVERESVADYVHETENLAHLHVQIRSCDELLQSMERVLGGFQLNLGQVSTEIKGLQQQAADLSYKARNRRDANARLVSVVEAVAVSPSLIHTINDKEVNETFIEHLLHLNKKLQCREQDALAQAAGATGALSVKPVLEKLKIKAVEKARAFLLQKIYSLARPKTNFQILQQNVLLKFKFLLDFLREHQHAVYEEVRAAASSAPSTTSLSLILQLQKYK